jgi:signal transduction histidine kinase
VAASVNLAMTANAPENAPDRVNILLVDDQPAKLLSYEVVLESLGETLLKAGSAHEALSLLLKQDVAVVLIDVQMPELDGFELAAMIREHPRFQRTPLIFVSAIHLSDIDRIKGYEAGAVDYVPVPVVPEVLRAKVKVFVDLYRKSRELERLNAELEQRVRDRTAALEASSAALQKLNEDLEARIEQRTREREQALAQLFEAQKIDTIGQLTGGVAHDFNNLLMAVLGSLQLLKKRLSDDPASQRLLDNAFKGAERGAALTQRLLAFARRQELRPEQVSAPTLIRGMKDLLDRALGPGVELAHDLPADLPPILIDPNQLELALLNLAVNARDAIPAGGRLVFKAREADAADHGAPAALNPGRYVRLSVIDTGVGMDEEVLARATEPFFTTKGVGKGTGLGLSMVHGLVAQSGGALEIDSRPGEGTRIELWIPLASPSADHWAPTPHACPDAGRMDTALHILVVDDDPLVSVGTAAMVEDLGYMVSEAPSGSAALAAIEADPTIDLVISDHAMPGMTGLELARRLAETHPEMIVILASGYADLPGNSGPVVDLPRLNKPFLQADLAKAIATAQRRGQALAGPKAAAAGV